MPQWIRLVTFTEQGVSFLRDNPEQFLAEMVQVIQENNGTLLNAYAALGPFDVISFIDAPSESVMERIDKAVEKQGYYTSETYHALPAAEWLQTVARSPIFLSSWLRGRELARAEAQVASAKARRARPLGKPRK